MNSLIRIWIGLMLLLMTALDAEGAEVSPIAILCPCSFEPQNQTYGLAKFSVVFNDPVAASGAVNVEFAMFKDLDFSNWSLLSSSEINSLAYKAAPQAVEVRLPTYAYSEPATGFAGLRITNTTDFNFYDGVLLSTSSSTRQKVYGLLSVNSLPMMFLTPPEFSATVDSATLTVSKLYTPALANETDSFDVLVTVGKGAESFFIKGTTLATVSYDADGIAQLQVTIPLSDALDNHLNQDGSKTEVQIRIKRGETQILSYWVDSLAADGVAPSIGSVMTAPDTLKDTDGDGISDFNEGLLGSDPRIQDLVDQVNIELVYTYGKTAKDQYGDELDARLILLHEAAKAVFSASGVPVNLVELQRVDVGDESGLSAEDVIAQMEQRTGLFADFDAKLDRKPDLIIHFGLEEVLDTGGLANLQGGLADGIIASGSAYASGLNVGVVGVDGVDELTLPHEIGHLMGLVHSKAQGEADGAFPWSRGHGVNGDFVTTMGYSTAFEDAPALGYFSSPSLKCGGSGLPCGIARSDYASGADAVLTLQTTAYQIAAISNGYSPVLTIIGDNPATVTSEAAISELTATATDAEDGSLTTKIKATIAAAPAGSQGFTHLQTYSVEDADRNTQSAIRKINLVEQAADSDNDGVVDEQDAFPNDSSETADTDNDGVGDGGTSGGGTDSGGDSGDTGGTDGGSAGTKTIEIDVVYDRVPYCTSPSCGSLGLDYAKTVQKPVRFAKAAVLDADSKQVLMDNLRTDAAGRVSFAVAVDQAFIVRVYAESSGDGTASWGLRIVDNNGADQEGTYPIYVLESGAINANAVTEPMTLQAESGWGLTKYTQTRSAAPFAILDSMISATLYALSGRSTLVFAPVDVYWSVANTSDSVGTSYYSGSYIMILGDAEVDTDEYDESVIVHEWGHYFQSILSRDDSVGGNHGSGDLLDMRVAFSEGWANAYSGLATARDAYIDTSGSQQAGGFGITLEAELSEGQGAVKGWYSEDSAQYLVYDLFDDGALDDDNVALPVSAMMASLIDFMPRQAAATSIFSFSAGVIDAQPNQSSGIMGLLDREDIGRGRTQVDPIGTGETNSAAQYAAIDNIAAVTLPVFTVVNEGLISAEMCQDVSPASAAREFGIDNKLGTYRFAQFEISQAGNYTVRLTTTEKPLGTASDPDFGIYNAEGLIGPELNELTADIDLESHTMLLAKGQYWAWVNDYNNYRRGGGSGRYCQRLEVVPQ